MIFVSFYLVPRGNWARWCRMRETQDDASSGADERGDEKLGDRRPGDLHVGAHVSMEDGSSSELVNGRLSVGRRHWGGSIDDFEDETPSGHSSDEDTTLSNQPVPLLGP